MPEDSERVPVFRSAAPDALEKAEEMQDLLLDAGFSAVIVDSATSGVPPGAFEVRVPTPQQDDAQKLIDTQPAPSAESPDPSQDLDMVPVFASDSADAELLAAGICSILEGQDIPALVVSGTMLPSLPFEVRVPKNRLQQARRAITEAEEAGPAAADEGEQESEAEGGASESGV
ncbi:MAG: hypothetical protein ACLQGV_18765 [Bryobacteraceae bacterium]